MSSKATRGGQASPLAIWAGMLAIYIIWGSTYLAIRYGVATIPPFLMLATRFLVAGGVLYLVRRAMGDPVPSRREWRGAGLAGIFLLTLGNGGVGWAEQRIPSGLAALLIGTTPLWFILLDWLRPGGTWPGWRPVVGVLVGFGGIALLVGPGDLNGAGRLDLASVAVLILATVFWATGSLVSRGAVFPASPLMGTAVEMLAGGAGLLVLGTITGEWGRLAPSQIAFSSVLGLVFLIVFGSWVAFSAYVWLLRVAPTPLVSTYAYVNPIVAIVLGSLIAHEAVGSRTVLAAAIIIGSVILTTLARRSEMRRASQAEA